MNINRSNYILPLFVLLLLVSFNATGQSTTDSVACLTRFTQGNRSSYRIPLTKFCFVKEAGIKATWPFGWIMKWDVSRKKNSSLLFLEMNSTDVEDWLGNGDVSGSVQIVLEVPAFRDSLEFTNLSYKTKGLNIINNYGGISARKESLTGSLKIKCVGGETFISSSLNLVTEQPNTRQQLLLWDDPVQTFSIDSYQEFENKREAKQEAEKEKFVTELTRAIITRDSIWEIENKRVEDSLKLHPYTGSFRFWVSHIDKAGYSRVTYAISNDTVMIKEGPYDFIYLAKNYPKDEVSFSRELSRNEKVALKEVEQLVRTDSLKSNYTNYCIMDGLILTFSFESAGFEKEVTVSNFYNQRIAAVLGYVNSIVPKKYRIWYDKEILLKEQAECGK